MKKSICLLMLVTSITGVAFAQTSQVKSDRIFDLTEDQVRRRFSFDLGKENKMVIEVAEKQDLDYLSNMDSIIRVFLADIQPFKDSLGDELLSRRIDYVTDSLGRKKIRIQQFHPKGSSFIVEGGEPAALKVEQDSIHILGRVSFRKKNKLQGTRYYRVSFFLNDLTDLAGYADGSLNKKIATLQQELEHPNGSTWSTTRSPGKAILKEEPTISARLPNGMTAGGDFITIRLSVDLQNYKKYFVPSFSAGVGLIFSNGITKKDFTLAWEPNFLFSQDSSGKLKSFRNDFLTVTAGYGFIKNKPVRKETHLVAIFSLGYLVKREGEYFDKHSFRLGAGRLSLFSGKTKIEPAMYFTGFFKGVTPGLRLIQSF